MRFNPEANWGANAGLGVARDALEPIKEKHPEISYADLYTLAGVVAVEESGGPTIPYRTGREDFEGGKTSPPDGRLPDADKGSRKMTAQHVRDVFYRMGFNDREIVALLGAHALGRCHTDRSGYWYVRKASRWFDCEYDDPTLLLIHATSFNSLPQTLLTYFLVSGDLGHSQRILFRTNIFGFSWRSVGHQR